MPQVDSVPDANKRLWVTFLEYDDQQQVPQTLPLYNAARPVSCLSTDARADMYRMLCAQVEVTAMRGKEVGVPRKKKTPAKSPAQGAPQASGAPAAACGACGCGGGCGGGGGGGGVRGAAQEGV